MVKSKRMFAVIFVAILMVICTFSGVTASAKRKTYRRVVTPSIQLVAQPKSSYMVGERVYAKVRTPNYSGRVEYRAVLWDQNNKKIINIWNRYPYYYQYIKPYGTSTFTFAWDAKNAGSYRIVVYVRKVGSRAAYESYTSTISFVVKDRLSLVSTYSMSVTSATNNYGLYNLLDTSYMTQEKINLLLENKIKDIKPIDINISTKVLGRTGYDFAAVLPTDMPDVQLWTKDRHGNWYDLNLEGWGIRDNFSLPAYYNNTIKVYPIFCDEGEYRLTFELVDGNNINNTLATTAHTFEVIYPKSIYSFYYAASPSGYTSGSLIETSGKTQNEINMLVGNAVKQITPIYTELFVARKGMSGYDTVKISALKTEGMQVWIKDKKSGNWIDINRNPLHFELLRDYDEYIEMYPIFEQPGNRTVNVRVIDTFDNNSITGFRAKINVSARSFYELSIKNIRDFSSGTLVDVDGKTQEQINEAVESATAVITPINIKLLSTVKGSSGYDAARFMPPRIENIQLWAKNADGNWIDINKFGWGPDDGFELPINYESITTVYPIFNQPGPYECNIRLVNLSDNYIIAEDIVEINVR